MSVDIVEARAFAVNGTVLVDKEGQVWLTFAARWSDVGAWVRWWLTPGTKKWVLIKKNERKYRIRAVRLSKAVVYLGRV